MGFGVKRNEKGQVAILFALVFTFMFVLFAFVVDFGHLVNDKINLQIAADSAAYAGAAWQARTLNRMGQINYKLRQNIKELAMRVGVTHMRHNRNFPRGNQYINGNPQAHQTEPFICQQAHGYQAISGLRYDVDTNLCRNASPTTGGLPPIVVPPVIASFDPFAVAIVASIRRIQLEANKECRAAANDNAVLARHLVDVYTRRSRWHYDQMKTVADFLNQVSQENPMSSNHPVVKAAFESARRNLTQSNFDDFKMQILQPRGNEYVRLNPYYLNAWIPYFNFNVSSNDGCVAQPSHVDFDNMVGGVEKERSIVTYFAVKLSSKPKLFFMPASWAAAAFPQLEAFAAAKPFGSRIGPAPTADPLVPTINRPGNNNPSLNFSFFPNDSLGIMNTKIMAYLDALHPYNRAGRPDGNQNTGWPEPSKSASVKQALQAIRAPTVFDSLFFTIFPDPNRKQDYLEPEFAEALYPDYLEASDTENNILSLPPSRTAAYMQVSSRNNGAGWLQVNAQNSGAGGPYQGYGEEQPSSHSVTSASGLPQMNDESKMREFGFAPPGLINSGFAPRGQRARIGYSVKFVGMDVLMRTLRVRVNSSGARGPIANPPTGDPNLSFVQH